MIEAKKNSFARHDGGPAFPQFDVIAGERDGHGDVIDAYTVARGGMTLRDWFAGQAICARWGDGTAMTPEDASSMAYQLADAMLAARKEASP
jgi:hypothetical protein